jgi:hypothetical protein
MMMMMMKKMMKILEEVVFFYYYYYYYYEGKIEIWLPRSVSLASQIPNDHHANSRVNNPLKMPMKTGLT